MFVTPRVSKSATDALEHITKTRRVPFPLGKKERRQRGQSVGCDSSIRTCHASCVKPAIPFALMRSQWNSSSDSVQEDSKDDENSNRLYYQSNYIETLPLQPFPVIEWESDEEDMCERDESCTSYSDTGDIFEVVSGKNVVCIEESLRNMCFQHPTPSREKRRKPKRLLRSLAYEANLSSLVNDCTQQNCVCQTPDEASSATCVNDFEEALRTN